VLGTEGHGMIVVFFGLLLVGSVAPRLWIANPSDPRSHKPYHHTKVADLSRAFVVQIA